MAIFCYICTGRLIPECSLVGSSVPGSSQGSRLVDTVGLPVGLPLLHGIQSFPQHFSSGTCLMSSVWIWVSASFSVNCQVCLSDDSYVRLLSASIT